MSFWWNSKPRSVRYFGVGFALMILTAIFARFSLQDWQYVTVAMMGLGGLFLFFCGILFGVLDLYRSFKKPASA
jgi:hypothetical protein